MEFTWLQYLLVGLAALAAGAVNALAGGGTLITFPILTAVGIPAVAANVTNTVALCPGYFGATWAQWKEIKEQRGRAALLLPVSALGGIIGGLLLINTGERVFRDLVPYLILLASLLLAVGEPLKAWLARRASQRPSSPRSHHLWSAGLVLLAAIYGGYFGAGLSVIVLAVLGLVLTDSLTRLNAIKQAIAFSVNIAAAIYFLFSGSVVWQVVLLMSICSLTGGALGGKLAGRIPAPTLRWTVVGIGVAVSVIYFLR
ncbi:MAG: sulfite exporter TauE/SafE family protein [Chloroflexi bacterium]|nr:sulfite exporter TauE/SafE family protein [Chloroflexota bacterium]